MARLLALASTLLTLHFGGASMLAQEAHSGFEQLHSQVDGLSSGVASDVQDLHVYLPAGS